VTVSGSGFFCTKIFGGGDMEQAVGTPKAGQIGVKFLIDSNIQLSDASITSIVLNFLKPNGSTLQKQATIESDIYATWTTASASDLDIAGDWRVAVEVVGTLFSGISESLSFQVLDAWG
jgi:hypothetical protein